MTALDVSVALCTWNGARFLAEQVRSICLQTRPPREIVLSDDGSSDASVEVVRHTVARCLQERPGLAIDLRVMVNQPALRVTRNFEQAASACRGALIALSDQDDVWVPDKLERIVALFEARPALLLVHSDARLVDGAGVPLGGTLFHALETRESELARIHGGRAFDVYLRRNLVTGATAVFRRELLDDARPFPVEWVHDEWIAIIASSLGEVDVIEAPLIDYRQHGGNQIGARRDTFREKLQKALGSRGSTHVKRAAKAEQVLQRLLGFGERISPQRIEQVRGKVTHQNFRAHLPKSRLARIGPVLREAATGRYDLYGRGFRGIVRDLFEAV